MKNWMVIGLFLSLTGCFPVKDNAYHEVYSTPEKLFEQILFTSRDTGYAIREICEPNTFQTIGLLVKETVDRGKTWKEIFKAPGEIGRLSYDGKNIYLYTQYFTTKKESFIFYTPDGQKWIKRDSFNFTLSNIYFKDSLNIYYNVPSPMRFYESHDGGENWNCFYKFKYRVPCSSLFFTDTIISYFTSTINTIAPPLNLLERLNLQEKRIDSILLPNGVEGDEISGNIATGKKDNNLLVYRINPDNTLTHLYTFDFGQRLSTNFLSTYQDKIYLSICDFTGAVFMDYFLVCSKDGGLTWEELYPRSLWGQLATYGDENGFALWICTYNETEYINI